MTHEERLIVTPYQPHRHRQLWLLVTAGILVSLFLGLVLGGRWFDQQMVEKRLLMQQLSGVDKELKQTQAQLTSAELNSEVDRRALETVRLELSQQQGALARAQEELTFYRNMLQEGGVTIGLMISGFSVSTNVDGGLDYRLVVQQRAGKLGRIKVTTKLEVEGALNGEPHRLVLNQLDPEQDNEHMYLRFRYFYVHDGRLQLPEGFVPQTVTVRAWPAGQSKKEVNRQFPWQLTEPLEEGESVTAGSAITDNTTGN